MTAKTFAALDPNGLGPDLELSQSNTVVTCTVNGDDFHRMVRGTIGAPDNTGFYFCEFAFYIDPDVLGAPNSPAGLIACGLATQTASFAQYVGETADTVGFKAGDGGIYTNDAQVAACDPIVFSIGSSAWYVGLVYDSNSNTSIWFVNGTIVAIYIVPSGKTWFPAITVSGPAAFSVFGWLNSGQRAFAFPLSTADGWYAVSGTSEPIYLTGVDDGPYVSRYSDTIPNRRFEPAIVSGEAFQITTTSGVWTWTTSSDGATFGTLSLANEFGRFDPDILRADYRDSKVTAMIVDWKGSLDDAIVVGTAILDDVGTSGDSAGTIQLRDIQTLLQKPLQRKLYPPFADSSVANTPIPIMLGACRNVDLGGELYDAVNRYYAISDAAVTRVANVFDMGAPLDPYTSQYVPTADGAGVILNAPPAGKLTADVSSIGGIPINTGNPDVLGGDGQFAVWTGTAPANFTFAGGTGNSIIKRGTAQAYPHNYYAQIQTTTPWQPSQGKFGVAMHYNTANLEPGRTYRITVRITDATGTPPTFVANGILGRAFGLQVRSANDALPFSAISPDGQPFTPPQFQGSSYSFEYTVPAGADRALYFIVSASDGGPGVGSGPADVTFGDIVVEELGQYVVQPLTGITLADLWRELMQRAQIPDAQWSLADCEAIDARMGYTYGVNITDAINIIDALRLVCDTICATVFVDAAGILRIRQLIEPIGEMPIASFDMNYVEYGVQVKQDWAPGLTNSAFARPNWSPYGDSDFVTDQATVPPEKKSQFMKVGQFTVTSAKSLKTAYAFADQAPTKKFFLDDPAQAQAEIDRVVGFYSTDRADNPRFFTFTVDYAGDPPLLLFGDIISLKYARYGCDNGRNLCVVGTVLAPRGKQITITGWG